MTKHTQGPWVAHIGNHDTYISMPDGAEIYTGTEDQNLETIEANARLIAAAPDLLEALEWCLMVYGHDWPENASIRETIKKAKGE